MDKNERREISLARRSGYDQGYRQAIVDLQGEINKVLYLLEGRIALGEVAYPLLSHLQELSKDQEPHLKKNV